MLAKFAVAGSAAALLYYLLFCRGSSADPPGPGWYPLIGSLFHLREPWYYFLYEKYRNSGMLLMRFGTQRVYVLSRWAEFKTAMIDNAESLAGRPTQRIASVLYGDTGGIALSDGQVWREYRRFTLKTLRDLGLGRRGVDEAIQEETSQLISELSLGKPVNTALTFSTASANVVCQLMFGRRVASEDPIFIELLEHFGRLTQSEESNLHHYMAMALDPIIGRCASLVRLVSNMPKSRSAIDSFRQLIDYNNSQVKAHSANLATEPRDYIEAHLIRQAAPDARVFNEIRLSWTVADLFIAGTDTTSNTLRWALLFMLREPQIAERVREEIRREVGEDRMPSLVDRKSLHYTQATMEEVHRVASLVPLGLVHRLLSEISIGGYKMPKDSLVMFNVFAIHRDPEVFPEPEAFRPERHLRDGQFVPCPTLATFGLGRRACLGEGLARTELFLFFSAIMQRFSFRLESGESRSLSDLMDREENFKGALLRSLPNYKLLFEPLVS